MKIKDLYQHYLAHKLIDTDSRAIRPGSLFFALKGEHFNGNEFAQMALDKGAAFAVIDEKKYAVNDRTVLVANVLDTLQKLANYHRKELNTPIIGLTGSNGKTTTKELIYAVLNKKYNCVATKGNLNNHIGVPLTLFQLNASTEIGIVEMGANHLKEIELLCEIAAPNFGYITNFGKAHLEGFGSVEGIIQGKSELYAYLRRNKEKVFVNANDEIQLKQAVGLNQITFDHESISFLEANPFVSVHFDGLEIKSKLIGHYNYQNIAAAIAIGNYFKVPTEDIKNAIESYSPSNNRSQIIKNGDNRIILDAYNANPTSMEAAIENLKGLKNTGKIAILGDMFELGSSSEEEHQKIAQLATDSGFDKVYLIGKAFSTTRVKNAFQFESYDAFEKSHPLLNFTQSTVLIKGSRGMALERVLNLFHF